MAIFFCHMWNLIGWLRAFSSCQIDMNEFTFSCVVSHSINCNRKKKTWSSWVLNKLNFYFYYICWKKVLSRLLTPTHFYFFHANSFLICYLKAQNGIAILFGRYLIVDGGKTSWRVSDLRFVEVVFTGTAALWLTFPAV